VNGGDAVVRASFEAFNRGDWEALGALWDPGGTVVAPAEWPEGGNREGWAEVRAQFERLKADWGEDHITGERVEPVADDIWLARFRWSGKGAGSGLEFDVQMWMLATIPGGERYTRAEYFMEEEAALAAARAVR
jgi:ketosteroid isomerase-like protein